MSYTKHYQETITVTGSKTVSVSYPASQSGGTTSATVNYTEYVPVAVNIHVDTIPFDTSVNNCNTNVNVLTGAVVATEAAQIASIDKNSKKVANTIISGFFSFIRSEISQQTAELSQNIDAHLMHLKELSQSCQNKKKQMESDYNRISSRYSKVFEDLNRELSNRVYELDKPTFVFKKEADHQKERNTDNDLVNTATIFGFESSGLQSKISASLAKKRAFDTINKVKMFLHLQKKLNNTVQHSMINENTASTKFFPICFVETLNEKSRIDKNIYFSNHLAALNEMANKNQLISQFSGSANRWIAIPKAYQANLSFYFHSELNNAYSSSEQHTVRVKEMILKISNLESISLINFQNN
ncbi:MAG TPA: hypothetical protein DCG69_01540 [Bacteroidales bacterium]|nr:hypothetical protein [Bacteroidales bacterium]